MSISVFDQAKPDGLEKWKQGVRQAPTNPRWSEHDSTIQLIVTQYNTFLKDTPGFRPLDWQLIKAMTWVETGANSPAWKTKPLQIGVSTDPGLGALFSGQEGGDLIVPPGMKLSKAGAQVDYVQNIRAAVGYLLMRMAQFDFKTILDADTTLGHVTVKDGDNLSKIARERGTTVDMLTTMNPKAAASVHKGQTLDYRKAAVRKVITGWRAFTPAIIAARYNGGGDPHYATKLEYALPLVRSTKAAA
jgi:hypothetical protein